MRSKHRPKQSACPLCQRSMALTFHHLIPRKLHRRNFFAKHFNREQLNQGIFICRTCHNAVHRFYDEMTLGKKLNSLEALLADPLLSQHFAWVGKQRIHSDH